MLGEIVIRLGQADEKPSIFKDPWALLITSLIAVSAIFIKEHVTRLQDRHNALQDKLEILLSLLRDPPMWAAGHITDPIDQGIEVRLQLGLWDMKVDSQVRMYFPSLLDEWGRISVAWDAYTELTAQESQHASQIERGGPQVGEPVYPHVPVAKIISAKQRALGMTLTLSEDAVAKHKTLTSEPRFYVLTRASRTYNFLRSVYICIARGW